MAVAAGMTEVTTLEVVAMEAAAATVVEITTTKVSAPRMECIYHGRIIQ